MNELVKWLRELQNSSLAPDTVFGEAADEIERLRHDLKDADSRWNHACRDIERLTAEIGRYRAVLLEIETLSVTANGIHRDPTNWMREIAHEALSAGEERDA